MRRRRRLRIRRADTYPARLFNSHDRCRAMMYAVLNLRSRHLDTVHLAGLINLRTMDIIHSTSLRSHTLRRLEWLFEKEHRINQQPLAVNQLVHAQVQMLTVDIPGPATVAEHHARRHPVA